MSEFNMLLTELKAGEKETIHALQGPSIMVVTAGSGILKAGMKDYLLKEGYVFFISYSTRLGLEANNALETHIAYCEV